MSRGNITRRGKRSWRIKFDVGEHALGRKTRYVTVKGTRQDAQRELTKLLAEADAGTLVEPTKITIEQHIKEWLDDGHQLAPKTVERYRELAQNQINPHLGAMTLQKLKPVRIKKWYADLLKAGGKNGRPLAALTVGHAHRVLHRALLQALETELISRNVASIINPPPVDAEEVEILTDEQVLTVLHKLEGHSMYSIVALDLATGLRRGELLALSFE